MKSLRHFLKNFIKNDGFWVFIAFFSVKICSFLTSVLLIRFLPKEEFGLISVAFAVLTIYAPLSGLGFPVALLRFGSILKTCEEKQNFGAVLLKRGAQFQTFLSLIFFFTGLFFIREQVGILPVFAAFAFRLAGLYIFSHIQSELRIIRGNRCFAVFTILNTLAAFVITVALTYIWGLSGYLFAAAVSPFFCMFWYKPSSHRINFDILPMGEVRKFAVHAAVTNILSELLFSADIIFLSFVLSENAVADYRTAILIPSNVVFLAQSFLQADYVLLASRSTDRKFIRNYIVQFYKLFIPVAAVVFLVGFIFDQQIISLFFGKKYSGIGSTFVILMFGFSFSMILRVFWGNLLAAMGKISANTFATALAVVLLLVFAYFLVPRFGILGMAVSMVIALFVCGLSLIIAYFLTSKKNA